MKIEKIDFKSINWKRKRQSKYSPIYKRARNLKINKCIKITFDKPIFFGSYFYPALRKNRKNNQNIYLKLKNLEYTGCRLPSKIWAVCRIKERR